jgi:hypothetical protein
MPDDKARCIGVEKVWTGPEPVWHESRLAPSESEKTANPPPSPDAGVPPEAELRFRSWVQQLPFVLGILLVVAIGDRFHDYGPGLLAVVGVLAGLAVAIIALRAVLVWFLRPFVDMFKGR